MASKSRARPKKPTKSGQRTPINAAHPQKKEGLFSYFFLPANWPDNLGDKVVGAVVFVAIYILLNIIFTAVLYVAGLLSQSNMLPVAEAVLLLTFSLSVFAYLLVYKRKSLNAMISELGLSIDKISLKIVGIGVLVFVVIFLFEVAVGVLSTITNINISTNVGMVLAGMPIWFLIFVAVIEPINEEIIFRGFMVPRIGIVLSSIVFGLGHASYDSTFYVDIIAAIIFGILTGYVFKKTGSLYPGIIAHILVNTLAVLAFLSLSAA